MIWIYTKTSEKSSITVENAWKQKIFKTMQKSAIDIKNTQAIFDIQMHRKKVFFMKTSWTFTRQDFISCDLICRNFMAAPVLFQEKNIPGIKNSGLYFNWHFILWKLQKIGTFLPNVLFPYFQVFFKKLFSGDFFWPSPSVLFTVIILNNSILESRALFTAWKPENRNRVKNKI